LAVVDYGNVDNFSGNTSVFKLPAARIGIRAVT